jgi:hypothetical protein
MGSPQNTVTYNGFTFPFVRLNTSSGVLYAEDGFTKVGVRYLFEISGWIGGTTQGDLNATILAMQTALRQPRGDFRVTWSGDGGGDTFHYFYEGGGAPTAGADLDWGPKPGELNFTRFTGGRAAMYRWTCSINVMDANLTTDVLAITWQFVHRVDASGFSTRTATGKLLLDSGIVQAGQSADHYRSVITNALPALTWFKTAEMDWAQSEDGRVLTFTITEVEQNWTLPSPITDGHVTWMSRLSGFGGDNALSVDYVLSGWLETSAAHTKYEILQVVFDLAAAKFGAISGTVIPGDRLIREDVYGRNRIDFSISATSPGGAAATGDIDYTVGLATFGLAPPGSDGRPIKINPYGQTDGLTSGSVGFSPILYDATSASVTQSGGYSFANQQQPPNTIEYSDSQRQPPGGSDLKNKLDGVSDVMKNNPIVLFHEEISYETDNNLRYFAPKAANTDPFIQQTAAPKLAVIQAGYMKQVAKTAADLTGPNPPLSDTSLNLHYQADKSYFSLGVPEPISDGTWNVYTTHWRYFMYCTKKLPTPDTFNLPNDPRRKGSDPTKPEQYPTNSLPAVITLPS